MQEDPFNFGILSVKSESNSSKIPTFTVSAGCSDGSIRFYSFTEDEKHANQIKKVEDSVYNPEEETDSSVSCLMHDTNSDLVAGVMSDGSLHVYDR